MVDTWKGRRTIHGVLGEEVLPGVAGPAAGVAARGLAAAPVIEAVHACTRHMQRQHS